MNNTLVWKKGEEEATNYLIAQGHTILERNWRVGHLEIDIISFSSYGIHFVEVKSRRNPIGYSPEECVNKKKQKNIVNAAKRYILKSKITNVEYHFDIIAITYNQNGNELRYFQDAWLPIYI